ncbi:MAG TPA: MFS transporter [Ktedonobacteraceae bacterium]|nr:MFS transporter [Ktedonobacteraceae bacterium]
MDAVNSTTAGTEVREVPGDNGLDLSSPYEGQEGNIKEQKVPLFINRNYALLFCGHAISISGDVIFTETLSLWVALSIARGQSWAPLALGGVLLAAIIPTLLLGSVAGVFVDRWVKRQTMLRMDAARTILVALLLPVTGVLPVGPLVKLVIIYAVVLLSSTCSQFFNPSSFALIGEIVPEKYLARASGLLQTMSGLAYVLAPPVAVVLFFAVGPQVAVLFNALSFACSFIAISFLRLPAATASVAQEPEKNFLREYFAGLRFIAQNRILLVALIGACLAVIPEGAQNALGIFFYQQNLHAPLPLFGLVGTATGIGTIAGALGAALFAERLGVGRVFSGSILVVGGLMIFYARTNSLIVALICVFLTGSLVAAVNVCVGPIALSVTPKEMLGRIGASSTSVLSLASLVSISLLSYLSSTLLQHFQINLLGASFSTYDSIFAVTGVIAVLGGVYTLSNLWRAKFAEPQPEQNPEAAEPQNQVAAESQASVVSNQV